MQIVNVKISGDWGIASLTVIDSNIRLPAGGGHVVLGKRVSSQWDVAFANEDRFYEWLPMVPESLMPADIKALFAPPQPPADIHIQAVYGFKLPWQGGVSHYIYQGPNGPPTHSNPVEHWAYDFAMSVGTEIWAAKGGTVRLIKENSNTGGCDPGLADQGNYVVVDHGDGTAALYLHLQYDGVVVDHGQPVSQGDLLGYSGETGYSCGAHLHFQVQTWTGAWWSQSLEIVFDDVVRPNTHTWVTSGNYRGGGPCPVPTLLSPANGS